MTSAWELVSVNATGGDLDRMLAAGWEPFAVAVILGVEMIYLRRPRKPAEPPQ